MCVGYLVFIMKVVWMVWGFVCVVLLCFSSVLPLLRVFSRSARGSVIS